MPDFRKLWSSNEKHGQLFKLGNSPTKNVNVKFQLANRAVKRAEFSANLMKKVVSVQKKKKMEEELVEVSRVNDIQEYRKTLVFRATPVKKRRGMVVEKSKKKLTKGTSPIFHTD